MKKNVMVSIKNIMAFVQKSVLLKANLKKQKGVLIYKPTPSNEFVTSKYISIASVSVKNNETELTELMCSISCNFVKAQITNQDNKIVSYEQPLQSFLVSARKQSVTRFNPMWFSTNSVSDELKISIKDFENVLVTKDLDFQLIVYFS